MENDYAWIAALVGGLIGAAVGTRANQKGIAPWRAVLAAAMIAGAVFLIGFGILALF